MARLSAKARKSVPPAKTGLPGKRTSKGGAVAGSYPMPDAKHAAAAKAMAARYASPAQRKTINAKANKILNKRGK